MRVLITGASGFLGKYLYEILPKKGYTPLSVSLPRNHDSFKEKFYINLFNLQKPDIIIHAAAVRRPKNYCDYRINAELPLFIYTQFKKFNKRGLFVYISSLNTILKDREDIYTNSKRDSESRLLGKKLIIIRPSLIWSRKCEGDAGRLYKYLSTKFPFHPVPYPGPLLMPIMIEDVVSYIADFLHGKADSRIINLYGNNVCTLWELSASMAKSLNTKIIPISISKIEAKLPRFVKSKLPLILRSSRAIEFMKSSNDISESIAVEFSI